MKKLQCHILEYASKAQRHVTRSTFASESESSSEKLFPALHLYYKLATSESSAEKALFRTTFALQIGWV